MQAGTCSKGDQCAFAHGVFESWLHPSKYKTQVRVDYRFRARALAGHAPLSCCSAIDCPEKLALRALSCSETRSRHSRKYHSEGTMHGTAALKLPSSCCPMLRGPVNKLAQRCHDMPPTGTHATAAPLHTCNVLLLVVCARWCCHVGIPAFARGWHLPEPSLWMPATRLQSRLARL